MTAENHCRIARWRPKGAAVWSEILPDRPALSDFMEDAREAEAVARGRPMKFYALVAVHADDSFMAALRHGVDVPWAAAPSLAAHYLLLDRMKRIGADG
jgi:hypothetical protein